MSLKLPLPDKQLVKMCVASEHAAGYVLLIEGYAQQSRHMPLSPLDPKKEFLATHFAFDKFGHILWGVEKPIIVMTDIKALTRFFRRNTSRLRFGILVIKPFSLIFH